MQVRRLWMNFRVADGGVCLVPKRGYLTPELHDSN
jgi:hypothetical protein